MLRGGVERRMSKKFCTCRPRLSGYDNSSACVAMWLKLRRLGVYKVKRMGMNLLSQGSDGECHNSPGSEGGSLDLVINTYCHGELRQFLIYTGPF